MVTDKNEVATMITKLRNETKSYLVEIKTLVDELNIPDKLYVISYFTYSLSISHNPQEESMCLGSYHVRNMGHKPITNPYLCIKIPKESPFSFHGKYVYEHFGQSLKSKGGWERINEKTNKEEYWLRPLTKTVIAPNETLSFSNFQIKWSPTESYAGSITGFTYSDELKNGVAVINPINLNGTIHIQGDENE